MGAAGVRAFFWRQVCRARVIHLAQNCDIKQQQSRSALIKEFVSNGEFERLKCRQVGGDEN